MIDRTLLCLVLFTLVVAASASPDDRTTGANSENWSFGYPSDEGGSGTSYLGVDIADVRAERLSELKLKEEHGAEVTMVDSDAPAGKAGLREHDVILSLNGTTVESAAQLRRMIKEIPPGRVVTLGISRDGQPLSIKVQLADRHKSMDWSPMNGDLVHIPPIQIPDIDIPVSIVIAHSSMRSGLMVENITPQLGDYFGVKNGKGVLVRSVEKGSRGEKAGFRAGDVIVKVNGQPVGDSADFSHALRGHPGATTPITVMRDKREQTLTLSLPDRKDSGQLLEESFDVPEITAQTQLAIGNTENETAHLALDMEKIQREFARSAELQKKAQIQFQEQQKEFQRKQKEFEKRATDEQKRALEQQQRALERYQKLVRELGRNWAEI
jgi:serine protease Do